MDNYKWWHDRVVYQIYPKSFKDSNGDGVGDIPGIISKLDYLKELGVGIVWLSPVYSSPNVDNGYDISDYYNINPEYGTLQDMFNLIDEAKKRDIKIIMDLVINHTSNEHEWFQKSRDKNSPYRDYYIWRKGKGKNPPNNWTSFFAEDCWEYDSQSGEYYLHLFAKQQPDLNYHNPKVIEEVKKILTFWLDHGVAGFRCDVINIIYKESLADGKKRIAITGLEHYLAKEGAHNVLKTLRKDVLNNYDCFAVGETVFVTPKIAGDLCGSKRGELDMVFAFEHMEVDQHFVKWIPKKFKPKLFFETIDKWQKVMEWNANYLENHDQGRSVSRFGNVQEYQLESSKVLATLLLTIRGTPYIYQGQEIGMTNYPFKSIDEVADVESHNFYKLARGLHIPKFFRYKMLMRGCRDHARTPVQWDSSKHAGFTESSPWLSVNPNFTAINVEDQQKNANSTLSFYKKIIKLRDECYALKWGRYESVLISKYVFAYKRIYEDECVLVILNFSKKSYRFKYVFENASILISNVGREVIDKNLDLQSYEAIILKI